MNTVIAHQPKMYNPAPTEHDFRPYPPAGPLQPPFEAPSGIDPRVDAPAYRAEPPLILPDEVCEYLRYFKACIEEQNVAEILNLYEFGFPDITERYYRDKFWPDEEKVRAVVGDDSEGSSIFIILYKELYYRYLYAKIQRGPGLEHRYQSYINYQDLFRYLLDTSEPQKLNLPNQWLWDIVDEFIYQFQSFCQYKANPNKRGAEELDDLIQIERQVWNLYPVLNILYSLLKKSQIKEQLKAMSAGEPTEVISDEFGRHPLYFKLGYFSLIGLLRLHTLLGDYYQAMSLVKFLEFEPKALYNTVPNCLVTLHYYVGFNHMMQRQYAEATRLFVNCQLYIQRTRNIMQQQSQKTYQFDVITKTNDQIYQLLAICLTLQPQRIDESVDAQLTEKMSERVSRLQKGELQEFETCFQFGCPKFICPTISQFDMSTGNFAKEPISQQSRVFMDEIKQQAQIPILRGYLKLYSTMPVSKLADFVEMEDEKLLSYLLAFKHKMFLAGKGTSSEEEASDLDFYIDKDMIYIADTKVARRYGEYFIRHIQKLAELNRNLNKSISSGVGAKK